MKYDYLNQVKDFIKTHYTTNTSKRYCAALDKIFRDYQFNSLDELDTSDLLADVQARFKTKNEFSAAKQALKCMQQTFPEFYAPTEHEFKKISIGKRNRSKRPKKEIDLDRYTRTVNQMSNSKFRLGFRLMRISGLRVSELAALKPENIELADNKIFINILHGKGDKAAQIECTEDPYVYEQLQKSINALPEGESLFYSANTMENEANRLNMECHDFRRIFAIETRNRLKKSMPVIEANAIVQEKLRHERFSTTKRYLFNRKLKVINISDNVRSMSERKNSIRNELFEQQISVAKAESHIKDIFINDRYWDTAKNRQKIYDACESCLGTYNLGCGEVVFSKNSLKESKNKQLKRGGNINTLLYAINNLSAVTSSAKLIQKHEDKYKDTRREDLCLKNVEVYLSLLEYDNSIIPVELEVKNFANGTRKLYMLVGMDKIDEVDIPTPTSHTKEYETRRAPSTSELSIADIVEHVKDGEFLKYVPNNLLSKQQIDKKEEALKAEKKKIWSLHRS